MKTWFLANGWRLFTLRVVQVGWKKPKTNPTEGPNSQAHIWELKTLVNIKGGNFKNYHYSLGGVVVAVQDFRRERERERERKWRIRERFCARYLPWRTCSTRYIPSLLVLLIARAPFATSLATIDLFCPDRSSGLC